MSDHIECDFEECTAHAPTTADVDYDGTIAYRDLCQDHLEMTKQNHDVISVTYWS